MVIERAAADDLAAVQRLLTVHGLPLDGVAEQLDSMLVARDQGRIVGVAAVELYEGGALLRSVAVDPAVQGRGLGHQLTEAAVGIARARRLDAVYLLTTTAEGFFPKLGFEQIRRDEVPASVQASVEFRSACPASATVMRKRIAPAPKPAAGPARERSSAG